MKKYIYTTYSYDLCTRLNLKYIIVYKTGNKITLYHNFIALVNVSAFDVIIVIDIIIIIVWL